MPSEYDEVLMEAAASMKPLSTSVLDLIAAVGRSQTELRDVAQILQQDPTLLAHVLREANSVAVGGGGRISDPLEAVVRLGTARVVSIAVMSSMADPLALPVEPYGLGPGELGVHAALTSRTAVLLRDVLGDVVPAEASTACVLHDIGKLVIASSLRDADAALFRRIEELDVDMAELEREVLGMEHGEVGRAVLANWNLPPDISAAVQFHHRPWDGGGTMAHVVALCNGLVHWIADRDQPLRPEAQTGAEKIGLTSDRLHLVAGRIVPASDEAQEGRDLVSRDEVRSARSNDVPGRRHDPRGSGRRR